MSLFALLIIVLFTVAGTLYVERALAQRRGLNQLPEAVSDGATLVANRIRNLGAQLTQPAHQGVAPAFRQWVNTQLPTDAPLRTWMSGLPEQSFNALTMQLGLFLDELNIDLAWLVNGDLDVRPELRQAVTEIAVNFCDSCRQAVSIQPALTEVRRFSTSVVQLTRPDGRETAQRLVVELRNQKLIPDSTPELPQTPDEARAAFIYTVIQQASQADHTRLHRILETVLSTNGATAGASTSSTVSSGQ